MCSPAVVGTMAGLESAGVPTVGLHAKLFQHLVVSAARACGMPGLRTAILPTGLDGLSAFELRAVIQGQEVLSGRAVFDVLVDSLTTPLSTEDRRGEPWARVTPRFVEETSSRDEGLVCRLFEDNHWTDGLPIVLPTESRVVEMLKGTSRPPDEIVGSLAPAAGREEWQSTVEKIAVNAVMAGARPEYLPVILAMASSGLSARLSSLRNAATLSIVNGPIRTELGMNAGMGAMGPYNHANATIGRAYGLLSANCQGGSVPGDTYLGALGNNYSYTSCFPENEEHSPWQPLHVMHGMRAEESAVSVFKGAWCTINGGGPGPGSEKMRAALVACDPGFPPLIVMTPALAQAYVDAGCPTKKDVTDLLARLSEIRADAYWSDGVVQTVHMPLAQTGVEPYASRLGAEPDTLLEAFASDQMNIVVLGDPGSGPMCKIIAGFYWTTVSVDRWR